MDLQELPFAKIIILREDIAEVIINDGIEMTAGMVDQYHNYLRSRLRSPFSLLVNKINAYSYDFSAQKNIANLDEIYLMAVVSYKRITEIATQSLASFPRDNDWNIKMFSNREDALQWLVSEHDKPIKIE